MLEVNVLHHCVLCCAHTLFPWQTWGVSVSFGCDTQIPLVQSMWAVTHLHLHELEPAHSPLTSAGFTAHTIPPTHTHKQTPSSLHHPPLRLSLFYLPLSVTHRPSRPPSRTSCPPRRRLRSAPLSTVVWALIAGEKKSRRKHTHTYTHTYTYRPVYTPFKPAHTQCTTAAGRSQPFSLRLHPDRLLGSRPPRATKLHFLLLFFLFSPSECASVSLPLSVYLFSDTPRGS